MEDIQFNKKGFYLLGAGGLSRELESWIVDSEFSQQYKLEGFIDDNLDALNGIKSDFEVLDSFSGSKWKGQNVLIGIASCETKSEIFDILVKGKCEILSFNHKFSIIGNNTDIGIGFILCPFAAVSCNVTIGKGVMVNLGTQIGHDVTIGDFTSIMANVDIGGGAVIGNSVFIGSNATILPGVKIPDGTRIGAGSVVLRSIKKAGTYFGNPAKAIF
ncbi:NeuD/PglB/VioB family sugar acetyltransferase [Chryseobacterium chendengshani]|uniref:NeuD/PglB/VioB family sugar acetyltransferase n=1 Tax=Chryseobacterium sp. LJ756 TaxID=2864113 RepID=UPI001C63BAAD|nr:NeuD/PglB/VioB family sugar acetyltransferase [Chryseobacterium sp. LJ756]MBW7676632.1 NeuD/PglB/VioB family sugar acetyltransferase [Chryseobacterium sp. LJ756]